MKPFQFETFAGVIIAGLLLAFAYMGGAASLGAHPWWAFKVGYLGVGAGAVLYLVLRAVRLPGWSGLLGFGILLLGAIWVTATGKTRFAASYAEDAFAGQMWFFGWIGIFAAAFLVCLQAIRLIVRR